MAAMNLTPTTAYRPTAQRPRLEPEPEPEGKGNAPHDDAQSATPVRIHAGDLIRPTSWTQGRSRLQLSSSRSYRQVRAQPQEIRLQARLDVLAQRLAAVDARLAQLRARPGGLGRTLSQGASVGAQAALRELLSQSAGQATALALVGALDNWASAGPVGRWAAPLTAGSATLVASLYFGRRTADVMIAGGLAPATALSRRVVVALPVMLDTLALVAAGATGGHAAASALALRTLGSRAGSVTSALLSQGQAGVWRTASVVTADGQPAPARRILRDMEPRRLILLTGLHTLTSLALLVFMTDWLAQQFGGSDRARDSAGAVCNVLLEVTLAFVSALVLACSAARAGLALETRGGQPGMALHNLQHPAATWDRARTQAGVRIWMRGVTSALPSAARTTAQAAGASPETGALEEAKVNGLMALRGWIAERPATLQAVAQERQWAALQVGLDQVHDEVAALPAQPQALRLRLVYGLRGDDQFTAIVVPAPPPDLGDD